MGGGQDDLGADHVAVSSAGAWARTVSSAVFLGGQDDHKRGRDDHGLVVPQHTHEGRSPRRAAMAGQRPGQDGRMAKIPTSTQTSLWQRLTSHARQRWPQIRQIHTRYRAGFAYIDAVTTTAKP